MKANQSFKEADEAVSPVIGVILMVAITVVLAAVVFVLVNDLGSGADSAPTMGISKDDTNDRLNMDVAPQDQTTWGDMTITSQGAAGADICFGFNTAATNGTTSTDCPTTPTSQDDLAAFAVVAPIAGGDYIEFCMRGTSSADDITIVVTHDGSGQVVKRSTFNNIAACA